MKSSCWLLVAILAILIFVMNYLPTKEMIVNPHLGAISNYVQPDPHLTPGIRLPVTEKEICQSGYSKTVRNVTSAIKKEVFNRYKLPWPPESGAYEVDHWISLELGGSNDIYNLFPQPAPDFHYKDKVENYLHQQVCKGKISLTEAQKMIYNWPQVYEQIK